MFRLLDVRHPSSMVELLFCKQWVIGSNPVGGSRLNDLIFLTLEVTISFVFQIFEKCID